MLIVALLLEHRSSSRRVPVCAASSHRVHAACPSCNGRVVTHAHLRMREVCHG